MILVIDNYDSFTYNLVQLIGELGYEPKIKRNDKISIKEIKRLDPDKIVISPGPGRPREAGVSLEVVKEFVGKIPILGVCLGYQTIGAAFGGDIVQASELVHGKTSKLVSKGRGIMSGIGNFTATRYHSLVIKEASLPDRFEVIARTEDGLLMGIADEKDKLYGFQFHPESVMTEAGKEIVGNFLQVDSLSVDS